jgi:glycosyltransferase involved in cell wall biosynthesis
VAVIYAVSMVKDEADIIGYTVGNMLAQVDHVVVADNSSTDGTRDILEGLAARSGRLTILDDAEPGYYQSDKMSALAALAYDEGATWVVPFDADEYWYSTEGGTVAATLYDVDAWPAAAAMLYDHVATGTNDKGVLLPWRRAHHLSMPKMAFRPRPGLIVEQGNHAVLYQGRRPAVRGGLLAVHHYPYRSEEQFIRKVRNGAAAYAAGGDRIRSDYGAHWRKWGTFGDDELVAIFRKWYYRDDPTVPIQIDGEWQEALVYDPPHVRAVV